MSAPPSFRRWHGAAASRGRFCMVLVAALLASEAGAQARRVTGRVLRPAADSMRGVAGAWVVLHRVGPEHSGPLDSTRTAGNGRFTIRYAPTGSPDAIYFVSATHDGIAYFSPPLDTGRTVEGAELAVFDTTSAPIPIHVRGHHVVVTAPEDDRTREVVEVFELANDSTVTRVAAGEVPVWSAALPEGATDVRIGEGDLSDDAIRTDSGRIRVYAPLAPGIKQLSYAYRVDAGGFPLSLPIEGRGGMLEVLLEEPNAVAAAPGLERVEPVTFESRTFNRFLAQEVSRTGSVLRIDVSPTSPAARTVWVVAIIASIATVMIVMLARSGRRPAHAGTPQERASERLAREIAELDVQMESTSDISDTARAAYGSRRAELKRQLASALDAEQRRA